MNGKVNSAMTILDDIRARVADCRTYSFGMCNADKIAHEDAPRLVAALEAVLSLAADDTVGWSYRDAITQALGAGDE